MFYTKFVIVLLYACYTIRAYYVLFVFLRDLNAIYMYMYVYTGDVLTPTTDIRTDCGYVLLSHSDRRALEADYETVVKLQPRLFTLSSDPTTSASTAAVSATTTAGQEEEEEEEVRELDSVFDKIAQDFKWGHNYDDATPPYIHHT